MVAVVVHQIYVGTDGDKQQPFFLSIVLTDSNNQGAPQYKAILWKKTVTRHTITTTTIAFDIKRRKFLFVLTGGAKDLSTTHSRKTFDS